MRILKGVVVSVIIIAFLVGVAILAQKLRGVLHSLPATDLKSMSTETEPSTTKQEPKTELDPDLESKTDPDPEQEPELESDPEPEGEHIGSALQELGENEFAEVPLIPEPVENNTTEDGSSREDLTDVQNSPLVESQPLQETGGSMVSAIPDMLATWYAKAPDGVHYQDLPTNTTQLVVVDDTKGVIRVHFFERDNENEWINYPEFTAQAWGGSNGIRLKQREGDKVTPVGQFPILDAFYIHEEPETRLNAFKISNDTYWVDDPNSVYYNQHVEGVDNKDWNSAEHMISYESSYKYGFVIGYNLDCIPGLGSAVFFHVAKRNTIGCIGVAEDTCLQYLGVLDKDKSPYILIVSDKD